MESRGLTVKKRLILLTSALVGLATILNACGSKKATPKPTVSSDGLYVEPAEPEDEWLDTDEDAVWPVKNRQWDDYWQNRYRLWVANHVDADFFTSLGAPFDKLKLDCADFHYALLSYFAREKNLPLSFNYGNWKQSTHRFSHIEDPDQRLYQWIRATSNNYGTENIVHSDSIPVGFDDLQAGDLFLYKIRSGDEFIRHTYLIKGINPNGTFDVLYSTQARAKEGLPPKRDRQRVFKYKPDNEGRDQNHWGFRRMKPPRFIRLSQEKIPLSDFSQYDLARELSSAKFFATLKKQIQTREETPTDILTRHLTRLCEDLKDRNDSVQLAIQYVESLGGACLNYQDYDAHSTPSRDFTFRQNYGALKTELKNLETLQLLDKADSGLLTIAQTLFATQRNPESEAMLTQYCSINPLSQTPIHLGILWNRFQEGLVSYHPNDTLERRWGERNSPHTSCYEYYGSPEEPLRIY